MQNSEVKYITFSCNEKLYAVDMFYAKGALEVSKITYLPNSPSFLCGLYNHRGNIISVLNLAYLLEKKEELIDTGYANILILSYLDKQIALAIDGINKILSHNKIAIEETESSDNLYLSGKIIYEEQSYTVLNAVNFYNLINFKNIKKIKESPTNNIDINDIDNIDSSELSIIGSSQNKNSATNTIIKDTQKEVAELIKKLSATKL